MHGEHSSKGYKKFNATFNFFSAVVYDTIVPQKHAQEPLRISKNEIEPSKTKKRTARVLHE
jgi:hypothetical protein